MASFGRFEVLREIGRGESAVVLEAIDPTLGRRVALKLLRSGERASFDEVERIRREADALAAVRHPNVVAVHEAGAVDGVPYVALEPVEGSSLGRLLRAGAPRDGLLDALEQAARGLGAAHRAGIVHRDLKPEHVLVDATGRARVIDFGLARLRDASVALTRTGDAIGTPHYMAPELARGQADAVGPWSDVWSLGAMLLELLSGAPPYPDARGPAELCAALAGSEEPPRARARRADVPPALDAVCARALRKAPRERFADATAFAEALAQARAGEAPAGPSRRPLLALGGAVLALVALALLVTSRLPGPEPTARPAHGAGPASGTASASVALEAPAWWRALEPEARPPLPLPPGLRFGAAPGEYVAAPDGSVLVWVAAGHFLMGSATGGGEREARAREVFLPGFFAGKHEVRVDQFAAFVAATGWRTAAEEQGGSMCTGTPSVARPGASWRDPEGDGRASPGDHPVVHVTWFDARAYAAWAGLALPGEAQWEKAAAWDPRTGHARRWSWGDELPGRDGPPPANVHDESAPRTSEPPFPDYRDGFARTAPVGSFPAGASPWGLLDATGNVGEWCADPWAGSEAPQPEFTTRVVRGGSWAEGPGRASCQWRGRTAAGFCCDTIGFRLVRVP